MPSFLRVEMPSPESAIALAGYREENLKLLSRQTGASLVMRGQELIISGTENGINLAKGVVNALEPLWSQEQPITSADIMTARHALDTDKVEELQAIHQDVVATTRRGEVVRAKNLSAEAIYQGPPDPRHGVLHRPRRHWQNLSGHHGRHAGAAK